MPRVHTTRGSITTESYIGLSDGRSDKSLLVVVWKAYMISVVHRI